MIPPQILDHVIQPINDAGDNGTRAEGTREEDRLDFLQVASFTVVICHDVGSVLSVVCRLKKA